MAGSLFDIFGDYSSRQTKSVSRQPHFNNENIGKVGLNEPLDGALHEPLKKGINEPLKMGLNQPLKKAGETKKSFFSNIGKAVESTPQKAFSPRMANVNSSVMKMLRSQDVYRVLDSDEDEGYLEEMVFTKPKNNFDNYQADLLDDICPITHGQCVDKSPPSTPPPSSAHHIMEFESFDEDDFFTDGFSNDSIPYEEDSNLPDIF